MAVTTGITFGLAELISTLATVKSGFEPSAGKTIGIYAALLVSHGCVNTFGVHILRYLNNSSILFHSLGVASLAIAVVAAAPTHQSAKFVFAKFYDDTGDPGWSVRASPEYVAVIGILMSQYTITGFDASAHLSEETRHAAQMAPLGVIMSVGVSAVFGFFYLLCLLFSIQDFEATVNSEVGQPVLQILLDIFGEDGAIILFTLIIICVWHCGLFSLTSNSRMMYAFARDRGLPSFFAHVDERVSSPVRTIWLAAFLAFCLGLPSLGSSVAFSAATSIATIGLYISYGIPILEGLIWPLHFKKGPFNLGRLSRPIAFVGVAWICFITIVFCLPELNPVDSQSKFLSPFLSPPSQTFPSDMADITKKPSIIHPSQWVSWRSSHWLVGSCGRGNGLRDPLERSWLKRRGFPLRNRGLLKRPRRRGKCLLCLVILIIRR